MNEFRIETLREPQVYHLYFVPERAPKWAVLESVIRSKSADIPATFDAY